MRFRLRTLLILMALLPPVLAIFYFILAPNSAQPRPQQGIWIYHARFIGNRSFSDKKLTKAIGLLNSNGIHGWRLSADSAEDSRKKIEQLYRQAGYLQVMVTVLTGGKQIDKELIFEIREGNQIARAVP
jgi:hypothetical protein